MNNNNISAIIIDDEPLAGEVIKKYLEAFPYITVVAECRNGFEGAKAIQQYKPGLVFLDVQMPKLNGFEMLEIVDFLPTIIFTTAYDEYALKAFEYSAVDYLLKPFSVERFAQALEKALERINQKEKVREIREFRPAPEGELLSRIVVKAANNIHIIPVAEVDVIEAQDDYVMIYSGKAKYLKQQTMKYYENYLDSSAFVRVHRTYIINLTTIDKIEPFEKDSYIIITKNQQKIKTSRAGYKKLKEKLGF